MAVICALDSDDGDVMRLSDYIEQLGHVFLPVFDLADARLVLSHGPSFDLFCIDLHLRGIDRREAANLLKDIAERVPVLGVTGDDPENKTSLVMASSFAGVVTKPFDPVVISATIDSLLGIGRIRQKIAERLNGHNSTRVVPDVFSPEDLDFE